jgi:hypothetical protein
MNIKIGDKKLLDLTPINLIDIAIIEGIHLHLEYWNMPNIIEFDNSLFSDTMVISYNQTKISDNILGDSIIMFFNYETFSHHWHFEHKERNTSSQKNICIETIKYLIKQGYNIPIY